VTGNGHGRGRGGVAWCIGLERDMVNPFSSVQGHPPGFRIVQISGFDVDLER
jgi:hypothetical protein